MKPPRITGARLAAAARAALLGAAVAMVTSLAASGYALASGQWRVPRLPTPATTPATAPVQPPSEAPACCRAQEPHHIRTSGTPA